MRQWYCIMKKRIHHDQTIVPHEGTVATVGITKHWYNTVKQIYCEAKIILLCSEITVKYYDAKHGCVTLF